MRCPSCQNENPPGSAYCDMCGHDLAAPKRATVVESAPPPPPQPANPHQKRHTIFEPEPVAPPQPPAGRAGADFFSQPPQPRPAFDPSDPFRAATAPPPAAAPQPAAQRPKPRTVLENPSEATALGLVRGALFEYRGPTDPGRVHPLRAGRNVLGRDPECNVVIEDGRISGQHAFLFLRAEDASYMDVSSNGSIVNGSVVHGEQVVLQNHAVLTLGGTTLVLALIPEQVLTRRSR
jgi:pSer/pThr/pTyr-binding forkhead associated (FHA) protein